MSLRVIIMGVAGCGKSSVGEGVSAVLGIPYLDGDDLHPAANVAKMRAGTPLTDADRWPWLDLVAQALADQAPVLIGCSALKRVYRDRIRAGAAGKVSFVYLDGSRDLIAGRMAQRRGHYMPLSLLDSQFAALEVPGPDEAFAVPIDQPLEAIVTAITGHLRGAQG
ncbi:gluconokinase [Pseudotabrizicola sp. 4114]|uniref:gluconokinase n=1 Tax=Pseudotabrizicola sp. 4114 TaxID=2817731 RepID=UPI002865C16E|nr:gluconokinase [Pseudorhodobacter sp. 4114]